LVGDKHVLGDYEFNENWCSVSYSFLGGTNKFLPYSQFISEFGEIQCKEMPHDVQRVIS